MKNIFTGLLLVGAIGVGTTGSLAFAPDFWPSSNSGDAPEALSTAEDFARQGAGAEDSAGKVAEPGTTTNGKPDTGDDQSATTATSNQTQTKDAKKVDFKTQIWPIIDKSCLRCHSAKKKKGKLRLDKKKFAFKKAETIVPGKPEESELYKLIDLPPDHEDYMPAKGDPLTKEQVELIKTWIEQGAEWPDG